MKISNSRSRRSSAFSGKQQVTTHQSELGQVTFAEHIRVVRANQTREDLEKLLPHLDEAAHALIEARTLRNLARFRELVQEFLDRVVRDSYQVREVSGFSSGRHKIMVIVQKVDEALEKLGREVLNQHASSVHLLEIVDEIRGLLLDLSI